MEINSARSIVSTSTTSTPGGRAIAACELVIASDAHSPAALGGFRWGVGVARRAWLEPQDVLNTQTGRRLSRGAAPQPLTRWPSAFRCTRCRRPARRRHPGRYQAALFQDERRNDRPRLRSRDRSPEVDTAARRSPARDGLHGGTCRDAKGVAEKRTEPALEPVSTRSALTISFRATSRSASGHVAVDGQHLDVLLVQPLQQLHRNAPAASSDSSTRPRITP